LLGIWPMAPCIVEKEIVLGYGLMLALLALYHVLDYLKFSKVAVVCFVVYN